ncbi:MAG: hypothetical protein GC145_18705 [Caulobacter sp.]|nr:hypothetical protein [Caulobacter sp.]
MTRLFGTLQDDGPPTDTALPPCQVCGEPAGFLRRMNIGGQVDRPVYSERYCFRHVPAVWNARRAS